MRTPHRVRLAALACVAAMGLGAAGLATAQVTYFERPPTPEQLRDALKRPAVAPATAPAAAPSGPRTRGIVWDQPGAQAAQQTQTAMTSEPPSANASPSAGAAPAGPAPAAAFPINFDLGSAKVAPASMAYIDAIAAVMVRDPGIRLVIEGHTDASGSYQRNMLLSWDRAYSVFKVLVERYGIDPVRLQPLGRGPLEPMPGVSPVDGVNRRVQFRIDG